MKHFINKIRTLCGSMRNSCSTLLHVKLEQMEINLLREISEARKAYQLHLGSTFHQGKRALFKHLHAVKPRSGAPGSVYLNHESASDPVEKCNLFNRYFNSTFSDPTPQSFFVDHLLLSENPSIVMQLSRNY